MLNQDSVVENLQRGIPEKWLAKNMFEETFSWSPLSNQDEPEEKWLQTLWVYLQKHFLQKLPSSLDGLPIVPFDFQQNKVRAVATLGKKSKIILVKNSNFLTAELTNSLKSHFQARVLSNVPPYFHHPDLKNFIFGTSHQDILEFLMLEKPCLASSKMSQFSSSLKEEWCQFLAGLPTDTDKRKRNFLKQLPIIKVRETTSKNSEEYSDLLSSSISIEPNELTEDLPLGISLPNPIVSQSSCYSMKLAIIVGLKTLTLEEFLTDVLDKHHYKDIPPNQKKTLMLWVLKLKRFSSFSEDFLRILRLLEFVPNKNGTLFKANELFDPDKTEISELLIGEDLFPSGEFRTNDILYALQKLGLQQKSNLNTVINTAKKIKLLHSEKILNTAEATSKSKAVVQQLGNLQKENEISEKHFEIIQQIAFLKILKDSPSNYPKNLCWHGKTVRAEFVSPKECRPSDLKNLISSTMVVCDLKVSFHSLKLLFGWISVPDDLMIQHLKNISCLDTRILSSQEKTQIKRMSEDIYRYISAEKNPKTVLNNLNKLKFFDWIWNGESFSNSSKVFLNLHSLDLRPHFFPIPEEFSSFHKLFKATGARNSFTEEDLVVILEKIKDKSESEKQSSNNEKELKTIIDILEWISKKKESLKKLQDRISVPIQGTNFQQVLLKPLNECMYLDTFLEETCSDEGLELEGLENKVFIVNHKVTSELAKSLGIPSMTNKLLNAEEVEFEQYGQHEPLTQRIKNILEEYPDDEGIFKELIQNADDAGATEVSFVIDSRISDKNSLLDPGMAKCQGKALWAYNNAIFQESDFQNLQKLGGQTKRDISEKIGRFGIGFNVVYHVTDVPSFVSGSKVVFFDPYTTHLTSQIRNLAKPGIKIDFVKTRYISRYQNQFYPYNGMFGCQVTSEPGKPVSTFSGTLFRLPFRTQLQQDVPMKDHMSTKVYGEAAIETLISNFLSTSDTLLLFTQNVKKVKLFTLTSQNPNEMTEVISTTKIIPEVFNQIHYLDQSKGILQMAAELVTQAEKLPSPQISTEVFEMITRKENSEEKCNWVAASCIGSKQAMDMARSADYKDLNLMPCGGIAVQLKQQDSEFYPQSIEGKTFCFLPMPLLTGLPVHVNGCFALSSNRRNLWESSEMDKGKRWNEALLIDSVSAAYASVLKTLQQFLPSNSKYQSEWLECYRSVFPMLESSRLTTEWDKLAFYTLQRISIENMSLFPVMKLLAKDSLIVEWFPADSPLNPAFFGQITPKSYHLTLQDKTQITAQKHISDVLLGLNFNLVHISFATYTDVLERACVTGCNVSPKTVADFLKQCELKQKLPIRLIETVFKSEQKLIDVLKYCLQSRKSDGTSLEGLPMLLTEDGMLRCFSQHQKVYNTFHSELITKHKDKFLKRTLTSLVDFSKNHFKEFGMKDLESLESTEVRKTLNTDWIGKFWSFFKEQVDEKKASKELALHLFSSWKIFPASVNQEILFIKLCKAKFNFLDEPRTMKESVMAKMLKSIGSMHFQSSILKKNISFDNVSAAVAQFATSLTDFEGIAQVLLQAFQQSTSMPVLSENDHIEILSFFEDEAKNLSLQAKNCLKTLPFFETIDGTKKALSNQTDLVKVIPSEMPSNISQDWTNWTAYVFLKKNNRLQNLYKFLGFAEMSSMEVYLTFIIDTFEKMADNDLQSHLEFLCSKLNSFGMLRTSSSLEIEKKVVAKLKKTPILGLKNNRKPASSYYDPSVPFMKKMLTEDKLLPACFMESEWISFFRKIGLKNEVSADLIIELANELAILKEFSDMSLITERSKYLFEHASNTKLLITDKTLLKKLSVIKFIPKDSNPALKKLHPYFEEHKGVLICLEKSIPNSKAKISWTSAHILPSWAVTSAVIASQLGVLTEPSIQVVVEHCKNLSIKQMTHKLEDDECCTEENSRLLEDVMREIYRFLLTKETIPFEPQLRSIACILVENGKKLVLPEEVSIDMKDELQPYLYKMPVEFGEFYRLFLSLGLTQCPTLKQLSSVLKRIFNSSEGQKLHLEEKRLARIAIQHFFNLLESLKSQTKTKKENQLTEKVEEEVKELYLLTKTDLLMKSTDLTFSDVPKFKLRLKEFQNEEPESTYFHQSFIMLLPESLKPKLLSNLVTEVLVTDLNLSCDAGSSDCKLKNDFLKLLAKDIFQAALYRLAHHASIKKNQPLDEEDVNQSIQQACNFEIECWPEIETYLKFNKDNSSIDNSKAQVKHFCPSDTRIIISHTKVTKFDLASILTESILEKMKEHVNSDARLAVQAVLNLDDPGQIDEKLDELNISALSEAPQLTENPGDVIDPTLHDYLQQNPCNYFRVGELVGFERNDDASGQSDDLKDYKVTYILAKIVEEIISASSDQQSFNFGKQYKIDIGLKVPITVGVLDIYKFSRKTPGKRKRFHYS